MVGIFRVRMECLFVLKLRQVLDIISSTVSPAPVIANGFGDLATYAVGCRVGFASPF